MVPAGVAIGMARSASRLLRDSLGSITTTSVRSVPLLTTCPTVLPFRAISTGDGDPSGDDFLQGLSCSTAAAIEQLGLAFFGACQQPRPHSRLAGSGPGGAPLALRR
jgi:hypothetical protein